MAFLLWEGTRRRGLALLCLLATHAAAQIPRPVMGTVRDQVSSELLLGATVRWAGSPGRATATDLRGTFALPAPPRPDTLVISYVGYRSFRQVLGAGPASLTVRLVPTTTLTLSQVTVTAKRPIAADFVLQELTYLDIVTNPAAAADPLLAVRTLPAATSLDESASLSLRGSDPSQTGIYLNNVPIYDAVKFAQLTGLGTFGIFSADLLRSVLVFPSNPPLEFGNAGAGLLSLSTDERRRESFLQASLGLGNAGLLGGRPVGRRGGMLKAYLNGQDGHLLRAVNPTALAQLPRLRLVDGGVHWASPVGSHGTLKAFAYGLGEQYAYRPATGGPADYEYHNQRAFYTLGYERTWPRADLTLSHGLSYRRTRDALGSYQTTRTGHDYYAAAHYRRYWGDQLSTRAGLSYDERELTLTGDFPLAGLGPGAGGPTYAATFERGRTRWEAYQYTKYGCGRWVAGLGLRLNALPRAAQPGYVSAQLSVRRNFGPHRFLNLAAGQYQSATSPDPVRFGFLATRSRQVALDYSATSATADGRTLTAAVYAKQETSLVSTRLLGAELYGQRTFGKHLRLDLAAATVHAEPTTYDAADGLARALAYAQRRYNLRFQLKSTLRWAGKAGEIGAFGQYRAGAPFTPILGADQDPATGAWQPRYAAPAGDDYLPNYFRVDLTASRLFRRRDSAATLVLYAGCSNVLDTRTVSGYAYSADYAQAVPEYFQRRLLYCGLVKTWQ